MYCSDDNDQVFLELIGQAKRAFYKGDLMKLFNEDNKLILSAKKVA